VGVVRVDVFADLAGGFSIALTLTNLAYALLGVSIGTVVGLLPGLGAVATISILLPLAVGLDNPVAGLIMLGGIYYGAMFGGTITAVLLDIPGETSAVVTAIEGHQLAKQGRAGVALAIAAVASFVGGTLSVVLLTFLSPTIATVGLRFGPPEYFGLVFLGLALVCGLVGDRPVKGYAMVLLGLAISFVGRDPITGEGRFTFGTHVLSDGLDFLPVAIGVFGIAEIMTTIARNRPFAAASMASVRLRSLWPTRRDWRLASPAVGRGTAVGFAVGVLPGAGATVSSFVAYGMEQKVSGSRHRSGPGGFGRGSIPGLAGAEAANNASTGGSLLPMLALGVPGSATTAVLLIALLLMGFAPGPRMFTDNPDVVWPFVASMYVGNVMLLVLNTLFIPLFVYLIRAGSRVINPVAIAISMIGVYIVMSRYFDLWTLLLFGLLGYVLQRFGYPPGPFILGLVLAPIAEQSLRQSLVISQGSPTIFVTRPIAAALVGLALLILATPLVGPVRRGLRRALRRPAAPTPVGTGGRG
jgi:putative tricarboxylic transport membrane protein